jgi:hypothetical protein
VTTGVPWSAPAAEPSDTAARHQRPPQPAPAAPGTEGRDGPRLVPRRPLATGEILDAAFVTLRRHPKLLLGLAASVTGVQHLLQLLVTLATRDAVGAPHVAAVAGNGFLTLVAVALLAGGAAVVVEADVGTGAESILQAEGADRIAVWRRLRERWLPLLGTVVAYALLTALGLALLALPGVYLAVGLAFALPVVMLEPVGVRAALRRSLWLIRTLWWRTAGVLLLCLVVLGLVALPFLLVLVPIGAVQLAAGDTASPALLVVVAVVDFAASTLLAPIYASTVALLYVDARRRREGVDLAIAAADPARPTIVHPVGAA